MHDQQLRVHNLPRDIDERELAGSTVILIDVLRATSTICTALAHGAREVVPFLEIEDALKAANDADRDDLVLGGERKGGKIPGFDVGNSPSEYTSEVVEGKRVFITTTNGTRAMHHARLAKRIVLGCFLNLSSVVASVKAEPRIDILCAGTDGGETGEDILAAGALVDALAGVHDAQTTLQVTRAWAAWTLVTTKTKISGRPLRDEIVRAMHETPGGRNLIGMGLDQDIVDCAQIDRFEIVPELDLEAWRIVGQCN